MALTENKALKLKFELVVAVDGRPKVRSFYKISSLDMNVESNTFHSNSFSIFGLIV